MGSSNRGHFSNSNTEHKSSRESSGKPRRSIAKRVFMLLFFMSIIMVLTVNVSARPILYRHHIVLFQGDRPETEEVEPKNEIYATERYFFLVPWNETWADVTVPFAAELDSLYLDHMIYIDSVGYNPGDYSAQWNPTNPPQKVFTSMEDMECCFAHSYAWEFPNGANRNLSASTQVDTDSEFLQYIDEGRSNGTWNFSAVGLMLEPGEPFASYVSTPTEIGANISSIELAWNASHKENVTLYVSNDNGTKWIDVTLLEGQDIHFDAMGNMLKWKINMTQDVLLNNTPVLDDLWINVTYVPMYTDIILQLNYILDKDSDKLTFTLDLYKDWENGIAPHMLVYLEKEHTAESQAVPLQLYGSQTEYPTKEVYIFMSGTYNPEGTISIISHEEEPEFPWFLTVAIILILLALLTFLVSRSQRSRLADEALNPPGDVDPEAELKELHAKEEGMNRAIEKLDSDYEEGLLDEDIYLDLKGNYEDKLAVLSNQIASVQIAAAAAASTTGAAEDDLEETSEGPIEESSEMEGLLKKKENILKSIKKLDSEFEEGEIDEDVYKNLRKSYKEKAVEIMKEIDELGED